MEPSLLDHLDAVLPHLGPSLAAGEARVQLRRLAGALAPHSLAGLECRLGAGKGRTDLQCLLSRPSLPSMARSAFRAGAPEPELFKAWIDAPAALAQVLPTVCLEYDLDEAPSRAGSSVSSSAVVPSIFLTLDGWARSARGAGRIARVCRMADAATLDQMERWLATLPDGAVVTHLGSMTGRAGRAFCVRVSALSMTAVAEACVGEVPLTLAVPGAVFEELGKRVDSVDLLVGLGGPETRVGLECFLSGPASSVDRWRPLLAHLVECGLCSTEKADDLLSWPGAQSIRAATAGAAPVRPRPRLGGSSLASCILRRINHVKLSLEAGAITEAKAYLSFRHLWVDRASLTSSATDRG